MLVVVVVVVGGLPVVVPPEVRQVGAGPALSVGWLAAVLAALVWLVTSATRAALQPARDRRAFERVQDLRVLSGLADHALLCVLRTVWSTAAGERVNAVDIRTGAAADFWLAESSLADGSYALVKFAGGTCVLVDAVPPGEVVAAQRHRRRDGESRRDRPPRLERRAVASVVRAAETLIR
jgi:hypothetical protein